MWFGTELVGLLELSGEYGVLKMRRFMGLLLIIMLMAFGLTTVGQTPKTTTFLSKDCGFSIQMPSRPKFVPDKSGIPNSIRPSQNFLVDEKEIAYYVSVTDYKPAYIKTGTPKFFLDAARNGSVGAIKGKVVSEKQLTIGDNPGREVIVEAAAPAKTTSRFRFYLVKNRLFYIAYDGPTGNATGPEVDKFFDSFRIAAPLKTLDEWKTIESAGGRFKVKMPATPETRLDKSDPATPVHLWQIIGENAVYFIAYNDAPTGTTLAGTEDVALNRGLDAVAKSMSATVVVKNWLAVNGNPGLDVQMHTGEIGAPNEGVAFFRSIIVK
ncbi:MAG: hypothetical protein ABJA67_16450, partial [Chthonomonadales bacterium]